MLSPNPILKAAQSTIDKLATSAAHVSRAGTISKPSHTNFLYFIYEPAPKPVNCTTYPSTRAILADPSHPLHIHTTRRFAAFDPGSLHWNVFVPVEVSKKAVVRNWVRRRIGEAFKKVLRNRGEFGRLNGALSMRVRSEMSNVAVTASGVEVEREVNRVVGTVLARSKGGDMKGQGRTSKRLAGVRSTENKASQDPETLLEKTEEV